MTPLTHAQRQALITRPFPIHTFGSIYPWGGMQIKTVTKEQEEMVDALLYPGYNAYNGVYADAAEVAELNPNDEWQEDAA